MNCLNLVVYSEVKQNLKCISWGYLVWIWDLNIALLSTLGQSGSIILPMKFNFISLGDLNCSLGLKEVVLVSSTVLFVYTPRIKSRTRCFCGFVV